MKLETKQITPSEVKFDDEQGTVTARFASFNSKDADNDVTLPGFFGKQTVAIAWAHDRARLVGKGVISETDDGAILAGQFFLDTIEGKQAYLTTKAMGDLQEWSYGYYILEGGAKLGEFEGGSVRFLTPKEDGTPGVKVAEVSPVLVGAGVGTATTSIKSTDGVRFVDQAIEVAKAAEMLVSRASEIAAIRGEKGKALGDEALASLLDVKTRLESVAVMLGDLVSPAIHVDQAAFLHVGSVLAESKRLIGAYDE